MPRRKHEKMMKKASERKLRKRWSFLDRVFRSASRDASEPGRPDALPETPNR